MRRKITTYSRPVRTTTSKQSTTKIRTTTYKPVYCPTTATTTITTTSKQTRTTTSRGHFPWVQVPTTTHKHVRRPSIQTISKPVNSPTTSTTSTTSKCLLQPLKIDRVDKGGSILCQLWLHYLTWISRPWVARLFCSRAKFKRKQDRYWTGFMTAANNSQLLLVSLADLLKLIT